MKTVTLPVGHVVTGELPLYGDVEPLNPDRHRDLALSTAPVDYTFAARNPTVYVTVDEFEVAMMDYPIIFYGPRRRAAVVTGLSADRNLFIAADGHHAPGAYVPAYLRRHPFVLARASDIETGKDGEQSVVCIDRSSDRLRPIDTADSAALFDAGEPSAAALDAISFARAYEQAERRTERFTALLDEFDLLEPRQALFRVSQQNEPVPLLDYAGVSRDKLDALDRDKLQILRDAGALVPIYAHLFSASRWDSLPIRADLEI